MQAFFIRFVTTFCVNHYFRYVGGCLVASASTWNTTFACWMAGKVWSYWIHMNCWEYFCSTPLAGGTFIKRKSLTTIREKKKKEFAMQVKYFYNKWKSNILQICVTTKNPTKMSNKAAHSPTNQGNAMLPGVIFLFIYSRLPLKRCGDHPIVSLTPNSSVTLRNSTSPSFTFFSLLYNLREAIIVFCMHCKRFFFLQWQRL